MNFRASLISLAMGFCLSTLAATANGQEKSKDKKELPKPETFELTTQDGLKLKGTYYASLEIGTNTKRWRSIFRN